jgi:hypothetical protein
MHGAIRPIPVVTKYYHSFSKQCNGQIPENCSCSTRVLAVPNGNPVCMMSCDTRHASHFHRKLSGPNNDVGGI